MKEYTEYELIYVISIDNFERTDSIREEVREIIKENGGKVTKESEPQKRKLAYPVQGKKSGAYLISRILIEKDKISKIKRQLKVKEGVLRSLLVLAESLPSSEEKVEKGGREESFNVPQKEAKKELPQEEKARVVSAPAVSQEETPKEKPADQPKGQPGQEPAKTSERKTTKSKITSPKDKLKLEELDRKIDDILKDDLI